MRMTPRFKERKTTQAAAVLVQLGGGRMNYMHLIKLLYLIDRQALTEWGQPVTFDAYVSMNQGPVLSRTLELINEGMRPGRPSYWNEHISIIERYDVELASPVPTGELSEAEVDLINATFEKYGHIGKWDLVDWLHDILPEWQDPEGSCLPIEYEGILEAVGKDEKDVKSILDELTLIGFVDELLPEEAV